MSKSDEYREMSREASWQADEKPWAREHLTTASREWSQAADREDRRK